jgi:flavin-dependent dehydrogenase
MFADEEYQLGYGWVFPVAATVETVRFNIGVGAAKVECAQAGRSLPAFFARFVEQHPALRRMAAHAISRTKPVGYPVSLAEAHAEVAPGRVLKIGDAANLTDPLTGEGIASALLSGRLAAQAIHETATAAQAAARWQGAYDQTFAPDFRVALRLRRLLATTTAKNAAVWVLGRTPSFARRFHEALSGTLRYRDLLPFHF